MHIIMFMYIIFVRYSYDIQVYETFAILPQKR